MVSLNTGIHKNRYTAGAPHGDSCGESRVSADMPAPSTGMSKTETERSISTSLCFEAYLVLLSSGQSCDQVHFLAHSAARCIHNWAKANVTGAAASSAMTMHNVSLELAQHMLSYGIAYAEGMHHAVFGTTALLSR
jgi:hypothetical protein